MTDHPLRSATRRCLGRPLPHQQADTPRPPPVAGACKQRLPLVPRSCDSGTSCGISPGFPGLSLSAGQVGHVLLTRSPLGCGGKPPLLVRLACIKHAASVRPEPGSNSPLRISLISSDKRARAFRPRATFGIYVVYPCRPRGRYRRDAVPAERAHSNTRNPCFQSSFPAFRDEPGEVRSAPRRPEASRARPAKLPASSRRVNTRRFRIVAGWMTGLEPATSGSTIRRSNQLSYTHHGACWSDVSRTGSAQEIPRAAGKVYEGKARVKGARRVAPEVRGVRALAGGPSRVPAHGTPVIRNRPHHLSSDVETKGCAR